MNTVQEQKINPNLHLSTEQRAFVSSRAYKLEARLEQKSLLKKISEGRTRL